MKFSGRRRLSTEISSSIASQWMPTPPPISSQSDRSLGVASASRGNHARGTDTTRPSDNVTDSVSFEHDTSTARASVFSTKVLRPFLQNELSVLRHDSPNLNHLMPAKAPHVSDRYRLEPELRVPSGVSHVDVGRLTPLLAEEEPLSKDPRTAGTLQV